MVKISFYKTKAEYLLNTCCQLIEKCYHSHAQSTVIVNSDIFMTQLDNSLWTYSRTQFLPHGTIHDPLPEAQPIHITNQFSNFNKSTIFILINLTKIEVLDILSNLQQDTLLQKLLLIFNDTSLIDEIEQVIKTSALNISTIDRFAFNSKMKWQQVEYYSK
jgi:DNA polymerase-3 subunit chi